MHRFTLTAFAHLTFVKSYTDSQWDRLTREWCDAPRNKKRAIVVRETESEEYSSYDRDQVNFKQNLTNHAKRLGIWEDRNTHPDMTREEQADWKAAQAIRVAAAMAAREKATERAEKKVREKLTRYGITMNQAKALADDIAHLQSL